MPRSSLRVRGVSYSGPKRESNRLWNGTLEDDYQWNETRADFACSSSERESHHRFAKTRTPLLIDEATALLIDEATALVGDGED